MGRGQFGLCLLGLDSSLSWCVKQAGGQCSCLGEHWALEVLKLALWHPEVWARQPWKLVCMQRGYFSSVVFFLYFTFLIFVNK